MDSYSIHEVEAAFSKLTKIGYSEKAAEAIWKWYHPELRRKQETSSDSILDNKGVGGLFGLFGFLIFVTGVLVCYFSFNLVQSDLVSSTFFLLFGTVFLLVGVAVFLIGFLRSKSRTRYICNY